VASYRAVLLQASYYHLEYPMPYGLGYIPVHEFVGFFHSIFPGNEDMSDHGVMIIEREGLMDVWQGVAIDSLKFH
jgi:hypothetical protein